MGDGGVIQLSHQTVLPGFDGRVKVHLLGWILTHLVSCKLRHAEYVEPFGLMSGLSLTRQSRRALRSYLLSIRVVVEERRLP